MAGAFTVGDFKAEGNGEVRKKAEKAVAKPVDKKPDAVAVETMSPAESYAARLRDAQIDADEANSVFDDVISKGFYQETSTIKGRKLILRTRTYEDHVRTMGAVELNSPKFQATQEELQARYNLAASLIEWNGVIYKTSGGDPEVEFSRTLDAIKRFPTPLYSLLIGALVKFDAKMYVIFSEGAAESF